MSVVINSRKSSNLSPLSGVSRAGPMDSVASFSFWVVGVGVMVMLAGQVLGSAVFCVLKISCTIKN